MFNKHIMSNVDIVTTNPPFSKFEKFIELILQAKCKFIVIGSKLSLSKKTTSGAWIDHLLRGGWNCGTNVSFVRPNKSVKNIGVSWFTNMFVEKRVGNIVTGRKMSDGNILYFDERPDVLYCSKKGGYKDYPDDYFGLCAVPVSSFHLFSDEYFDFVLPNNFCDMKVNGKKVFARIVVKRKV